MYHLLTLCSCRSYAWPTLLACSLCFNSWGWTESPVYACLAPGPSRGHLANVSNHVTVICSPKKGKQTCV